MVNRKSLSIYRKISNAHLEESAQELKLTNEACSDLSYEKFLQLVQKMNISLDSGSEEEVE